MVLFYLRYVEGKRPDIELDPYCHEHFVLLQRWQEEHDISTHPIVFLGRLPGLTERIMGLDSINVYDDHTLYICRKPIE